MYIHTNIYGERGKERKREKSICKFISPNQQHLNWAQTKARGPEHTAGLLHDWQDFKYMADLLPLHRQEFPEAEHLRLQLTFQYGT